jgi:3-deoxy-D-manno-octulosonate 8-phosphate phosphatase (KDO 8-P phosphatase)
MHKQDLIQEKARKIKLVLTDSDGVLTDNGVYYSAQGEEMKRFSIRDGMGVERLRNCGIETGIVTGEMSPSVVKRAEKLQIKELHLGVKNKGAQLEEIMTRKQLLPEQIAFIGDDTNDLEIMQLVGLSACPADAMHFAKEVADYICTTNGGHGCFRELAELIILSQPEPRPIRPDNHLLLNH